MLLNYFLPLPANEKDMRLSGLQREVLSLYRKCLRGARKKPEVDIECRHRGLRLLTTGIER
jgi:hypothetical protein